MKTRTYGTGSFRRLPSGNYQLRYNGKTKVVAAMNDKQADRLLRDWVDELDEEEKRGPKISMSYVLDLYLIDHRKQNCVETPIVEKKIEKYIRPRIGHLDAETFGTEEMDFYIDSRRKDVHPRTGKPPANGTLNREISIVSHGLRLAAPKLQRIVLFGKSFLKEARPRQGTTSEEVYQALLVELPDYVKPLWCYAYYTGVRSGQLKKFRWEWLDWEEWVVRCPGYYGAQRITKNGEPHPVPVFLEMQGFTKWMWETRNPSCPYMFQRRGKQIRDFRAAFKAACERVGVPDVLFHDQRRTAVTNMIRSGVAEKDAMAVSGHLDGSMLDRYMIVKEQDVKRVASHMTEKHREKRAQRAREAAAETEQSWHEPSRDSSTPVPPNGRKPQQ
jgi:integrase